MNINDEPEAIWEECSFQTTTHPLHAPNKIATSVTLQA
jgi:hypothetical protein